MKRREDLQPGDWYGSHRIEAYSYPKGKPLSAKRAAELKQSCRPIAEFPGYWISRDGRLYVLDARFSSKFGMIKPHELRPYKSKRGYEVRALRRAIPVIGFGPDYYLPRVEFPVRRIHRLVAQTWIGPAPSSKHEVCHKDGNTVNNDYENLYWGTNADNVADAAWHRIVGKGKPESIRPELRAEKTERAETTTLTSVSLQGVTCPAKAVCGALAEQPSHVRKIPERSESECR